MEEECLNEGGINRGFSVYSNHGNNIRTLFIKHIVFYYHEIKPRSNEDKSARVDELQLSLTFERIVNRIDGLETH